jgi:hypothetical protein
LRESGEITYVAAYEPFPHFEFRFAQLDNRDRSYEFRNDLSFGGGGRAVDYNRRRPTEVVRDVYVAVFGGLTEEEIRKLLRITEGRHFDFYKWQRDRDRLQKLFVERGFFEAALPPGAILRRRRHRSPASCRRSISATRLKPVRQPSSASPD